MFCNSGNRLCTLVDCSHNARDDCAAKIQCFSSVKVGSVLEKRLFLFTVNFEEKKFCKCEYQFGKRSLCTRRLQPPRDDCAVRIQWFSSVKVGSVLQKRLLLFMINFEEKSFCKYEYQFVKRSLCTRRLQPPRDDCAVRV